MPKKSICSLLIVEVLNPFYIFQMLSVIFWYIDDYIAYACCILTVSIGSVVLSLVETRKNHAQIVEMAKYETQVKKMTAGRQLKQVSSTELVPGDIVVVPESQLLPCDMILLTGTVIMNEAILTGESIPVLKSCIPYMSNEVYSDSESTKHTLFGGTSVIQTRG